MNGMGRWNGLLALLMLLLAACGGQGSETPEEAAARQVAEQAAARQEAQQEQNQARIEHATAQAAPVIAQATAEAQLDPMPPAEALAAALTARDAAAAEDYAPGFASVLLNRMANQESAHAATIQSITVEPGPPDRPNIVWFYYHLDNGTTIKEATSFNWTPDGRWEYSGSGDPEVGILQPDGTLADAPTPEPTPVPDVTPILQRMADAITRGEYTAIEDLVDDPETVFGNYRTQQELTRGAFLGTVTVAPFTDDAQRHQWGPAGGFLVWDFERATTYQAIKIDQSGGGITVTVYNTGPTEFKNQ